MNNLKKILSLFLIIAFSQSSFAQEKSEKVSDFSYDLLQKSYSKNDRISINNKDEFLKELQKTNFIKGTLYFSGVGFPKVNSFTISGNLNLSVSQFEKLVAGSQITFDNVIIKNNDGSIIKDFQKSILFY